MQFVNLTNANTQVKERMTYFLECFSFINEFLGILPMYPFDHPISLVNKIRNEIINNKEHCCEYIGHHIKELTRTFDFLLDKRQQPYKSILNQLFIPFLDEEVKHSRRNSKLTKLQQQLIDNYPNLLADLEQFENDLSLTLLDTAIDRIYHFIVCNIRTHDHKLDIAKWAHVIVAYTRLENFSKSEVYHLPQRILSRDIQVYQFPKKILELKHIKPKEFVTAADKHLKRRTLLSQLKGLKNIIEAPAYQLGWYLFPIQNTSFQHQIYKMIDVTVNKVSFVWSMHPKLSEIRTAMRANAKHRGSEKAYKKYFRRTTIIAMVQVNYERTRGSKNFAYRQVLQELSSLNNYFGTEMSSSSDDILFTTDFKSGSFEYNREWPADMNVSNKHILDAKNNPYLQLSKYVSPVVDVLLNSEGVFTRAYALKDPAGLWQYLENIFWFPGIGNNKKVKGGFAKIALRIIPQYIAQVQNSFAYAVKMNWHEIDIGILQTDREEIYQEVIQNMNSEYDFQKYAKSWKRLFLSYFLKQLLHISEPTSLIAWESHFSALISELKSYRNFAQHQGGYNKYSVLKLETLMPYLISKIRWEMIHEVKKSPSLTNEQFLKHMIPGYDTL